MAPLTPKKWHPAGPLLTKNLARLADRLLVAGDARDVLAARDSLIRLLDVRPFEP
jgi:hypothetical protein